MDQGKHRDATETWNNAARLRNNGAIAEAISKYQELFNLHLEENDPNAAAEAQQMIGVCYKIENKLPKAIASLEKALDLYKKTGNSVGLGNTYRDIGIAYTYNHHYQEAIPWLEQSIETLKETDDLAARGISWAKLGLNYLRLGDTRLARKHMKKGLKLIRQHGHWFFEMTTLLNLAEVDLAEKKFDPLLTHLWACLGLIHENDAVTKQQRRLAQVYGLLSHGYLACNNVKLACRYLHQVIDQLTQMSTETREVVYEDIQLPELMNRLHQKAPRKYRELQGRLP